MTIQMGRVSVSVRKGRSARPRERFHRGPYGAWTANLVSGPLFSVSAIRRYPDDRLRCPQCGYRKNDT